MLRETGKRGREPDMFSFSRKKRGQLKGYSGNELTLTQESVQRVCIICTKYLLSHLEMTSALHRPPLTTGRGKTWVARVPLSWKKGQ